MKKLAYGIDFGTTHSAISYLDGRDARIVPVGNNGRKMIRSELFFPREENKIYIGDDAFDEYLASEKEGRFIQSIKTVLPSQLFTSTRIKNEEYEVEDLVALFLEYLKEKADKVTGQDVTRVVLGRPVVFAGEGKNKQLALQRLRTAAEYAGFEEIEFQFEPVAAAMAYERTLDRDKLVLITDFGGGTSDFTLIRLGPSKIGNQDRRQDILGTSGVGIAGDALDSAVMAHSFRDYFGASVRYENWPGQWLSLPASIFVDLCDKGRVIYLYTEGMREQIKYIIYNANDPEPVSRLLKLIENNLGHQVYQAIENAKKDLSKTDQAHIHFVKDGLKLHEALNRKQFDRIIKDKVIQIDNCIDDLLQQTGVSADQIDTVYMTGGTSLVPRLQTLLKHKFQNSQHTLSSDSFLSVVNGLALGVTG